MRERAGTLPTSTAPYDVNQIKAKMNQMYSLTATSTTPPPSMSVGKAPASDELDVDSGIDKEASSDSSSLYGSDVSSGGSEASKRATVVSLIFCCSFPHFSWSGTLGFHAFFFASTRCKRSHGRSSPTPTDGTAPTQCVPGPEPPPSTMSATVLL